MGSHGIPEGTTFIWEQAEKRLEAQLRQADALDTKAGALVGLHALAAGLISTVAGRLSGVSRWVAVGSILGLIVSGLFAFGAFRTEAYARSPAPEELWRFGDWGREEIQFRFLTTRFDALDRNRAKLHRKSAVHLRKPGRIRDGSLRRRGSRCHRPCEVPMRTKEDPQTWTGPKLPPPPPQREDIVNDLGWLSRGPDRRARKLAQRHVAPLLLSDGEPSPLPPDPVQPPPLPEPPPQVPDVDERGGGGAGSK